MALYLLSVPSMRQAASHRAREVLESLGEEQQVFIPSG